MKPIKILGVRIDHLTRDELRDYFREKISGNKFCQIATVNPEFLVYAEKNPDFKKLLNRTDLNICDGVGISFLGKILYGYDIHRITGVEVAEILVEICAEKKAPLFFLGGYQVAEKAAQKMKEKYPSLEIAGTFDGDLETLNEVQKENPCAVLVAFGSPKQEIWLDKKATQIKSLRIGIGIGGTFDFWSGKIKRAPLKIQKIGLEWLYRLLTQPQRFIRIFRAVVIFPGYMIKNKLKEVFKRESLS